MNSWTNRDWFWITGILIAIIITCFAFFLSGNDRVVEIFSFLASGVSIALAVVAIYVSSNQNRDSQSLSQNMNETLARLDEKIQSVNEKVDKIDVNPLIQDTQQRVFSELTKKIQTENGEEKNQLLESISQEFNNLKTQMNKQLTQNKNAGNKSRILSVEDINSLKDQIFTANPDFKDKETSYSKEEIRFLLEHTWGTTPSSFVFDMALRELVKEGKMELKSDGQYSFT